MTTISCTYRKTLYRNEKTGYTVFSINTKEYDEYRNGNGELICSGSIPIYTPNTPLVMDGDFVYKNRQYTFLIKNIRIYSDEKSTLLKFLSSEEFKGIGPKTAEKIVDFVGLNIFEFIKDENADKILSENIKDLTLQKAREFVQTLNKTTQQHAVLTYIQPFGGNFIDSIKICEANKVDSLNHFKRKVYEVGEKAGVSFHICDAIAKSLGGLAYDESRIEAMVLQALYTISNNGHMFATLEMLRKCVSGIVKQSAFHDNIIDALIIRTAYKSPRIVVENVNSEIRFYTKGNWKDEEKIVKDLFRIQNSAVNLGCDDIEALILDIEKTLDIKYSKKQKESFNFLRTSGLKILTGGPGTGKTTVINGLIAAYKKILPDKHIVLCAPTGRAAQRMKESTGMNASTIHKLLEIKPFNDEFSYRDQLNPINADFLIIDEMSMTDSNVFSMLVGAIKNGALVVLSGDVDQLPSVGPGKVLTDLINSKVFEVNKLDVIYRQVSHSPIIDNAIRINKGKTELTDSPDFRVMRAASEDDMVNKLVDIIKPRKDVNIQILSSVKKGYAGTEYLNTTLQDIINPGNEGLVYGNTQYRLGDKVIMTKNNYDLGYINGDVGTITDIADNTLFIDIGGEEIVIQRELLSDVSLAYALTIHKSQGSEHDIVIVMLPKEPSNMLKRNLIYTAVTRAKKYVVIITLDNALETAIASKDCTKRNTGLKNKLCKAPYNVVC